MACLLLVLFLLLYGTSIVKKMTQKLTTLAIAVVVVGMVLGVYNLFIIDGSDEYDVDHTSIDFEKYDKIQQVWDDQREVESKALNITSQTGSFDFLGDIFNKGYQALKLLYASTEFAYDITSDAASDTTFGSATRYVFISLQVILGLLVVGVILSVVLKRDI